MTQFLVPTLRPGDVVVLDNLGSHKGAAVRRAIRDTGPHLLFLPPYSPDLNPIEMVFAKLKMLPRRADQRSVAAVWHRIGSLLQQFSPANVRITSGMQDTTRPDPAAPMAEATGAPILIDPDTAAFTAHQVARPRGGLLSFQPLWELITEQEPELLD